MHSFQKFEIKILLIAFDDLTKTCAMVVWYHTQADLNCITTLTLLALLEDVGAKPVVADDSEKGEEDEDYPSYDNNVISPPRSIFYLLTIPALRACRTKSNVSADEARFGKFGGLLLARTNKFDNNSPLQWLLFFARCHVSAGFVLCHDLIDVLFA